MNSWFMVSERDGEAGIFRVEDDGTLTYLTCNFLIWVACRRMTGMAHIVRAVCVY